MIAQFKELISNYNTFIYDIIIICGGMPLNSGVSSVLFQVWAIRDNYIIALGMSLKFGDARREHLSWSMDFICCYVTNCYEGAHCQVIFKS